MSKYQIADQNSLLLVILDMCVYVYAALLERGSCCT